MTDTTQTAAAATLSYKDTDLSLPVVPAVEGNNGLDISALMKTTGDVTLDVGFVNTASCQSDITYIDGDAGILRYRGYPIEQLAEHSTYLETSYLLIHGEGLVKVVGPVSWLMFIAVAILEVLIQFLQAYVFVLLNATYIQGALAEEH